MLRDRPITAKADLGAKAFDTFKRIAAQDQPNGAATLAYERLVPQFSTAPKPDTDETLVLMRYWSRKGDKEALIQYGQELRNWSRDNGYHHP